MPGIAGAVVDNKHEKVKLSNLYEEVGPYAPNRTIVRNTLTGSLALSAEIPVCASKSGSSFNILHHIRLLRYTTSAYVLSIHNVSIQSDKAIVTLDYPGGGTLRSVFDERIAMTHYFEGDEILDLLSQLCTMVSEVSFLYTSHILCFYPIISPDTLIYNEYGCLQLDLLSSLEYAARLQSGQSLLPQDLNVQHYHDAEVSVSGDISEASVTYTIGTLLYEALTLRQSYLYPSTFLYPLHVSLPCTPELATLSPADPTADLLLRCERWQRFFVRHGICRESFRVKLHVTPYLRRVIACLESLAATLQFTTSSAHRARMLQELIQLLIPGDPGLLCAPSYQEFSFEDAASQRLQENTLLGLRLLADEMTANFDAVALTPWVKRERPVLPAELQRRYSSALLRLVSKMLILTPEDRIPISDVIASALIRPPRNIITPLMIAAKKGDVGAARKLLGRYRRHCDSEHNTALMHAVLAHHYEVALLLAPHEAGAVNNEGKNASYFLLDACGDGTSLSKADLSLVRQILLILMVHESRWTFADEQTLLMRAAAANNMLFVRTLAVEELLLVDSHALCSAVYALRAYSRTAFCYLVGREEQLLLKLGYTRLMIHAASNNVSGLLEDLRSGYTSTHQYSPDGLTSLMYAASMNSLEAVELLIDCEAGLKLQSSQKTALMLAIERGHEDVALLLAPHECTCRAFNGRTALMYAAERNLIHVAHALVESEVGLKDLQITTALMVAASCNNVEIVEVLAPLEATIISREGFTALMLAAQKNNVDVVKVLLPYELSIKSPASGSTALIHAVTSGSTDAVRILARYEPSFRNQDGKTATEIAQQNQRGDLVQVLGRHETFERHEDGLTPLMIDAIRNDVAAVRQHVEPYLRSLDVADTMDNYLAPSQIGLRDNMGKTALIHAIENEAIDAATLLLDCEVGSRDHAGYCAVYYLLFIKRSLKDEFFCRLFDVEGPLLEAVGFTPAMMSVLMRNTMVIKLQLELYAGMSTRDGYTALMLAAILGYTEIVLLLCPFESGCQSITGYTALMFAAERNHMDVAMTLIEAGNELRLQERTGWTALMIAAKKGYLELVSLLAPHECGLSDCMGCTALFRAVQDNHFGAVQILAEYEAGLCTTGLYPKGKGWSALCEAIYNGYPNCVALLLIREADLLNYSDEYLFSCAENQHPTTPAERRLLCRSLVYNFITRRAQCATANK